MQSNCKMKFIINVHLGNLRAVRSEAHPQGETETEWESSVVIKVTGFLRTLEKIKLSRTVTFGMQDETTYHLTQFHFWLSPSPVTQDSMRRMLKCKFKFSERASFIQVLRQHHNVFAWRANMIKLTWIKELRMAVFSEYFCCCCCRCGGGGGGGCCRCS